MYFCDMMQGMSLASISIVVECCISSTVENDSRRLPELLELDANKKYWFDLEVWSSWNDLADSESIGLQANTEIKKSRD